MVTTHPALNKTQLNNRTLWYDGESSYSLNGLYELLLSGNGLTNVNVDSDDLIEVKEFNKRVDESERLREKNGLNEDLIKFDWNISDYYKSIDINSHILGLLEIELDKEENHFTKKERAKRVGRVQEELDLWNSNNLENLLRTIIYMIDCMRDSDVVWGTGRGSSCASYILYLIGLHDVDSVYYELELSEFFRL